VGGRVVGDGGGVRTVLIACPCDHAVMSDDTGKSDATGKSDDTGMSDDTAGPIVRVRPMTQAEYDHWQVHLADDYANEQVAAGRWPAQGALQRALEENARSLPDGLDTARMLLLRGVLDDDTPIGRAWVSLDHPREAPDVAFLYDIEVESDFRGQGLGRALLSAVEQAVREAGVGSLELNVFGRNHVAVRLYSSQVYEVVTQQMRKAL